MSFVTLSYSLFQKILSCNSGGIIRPESFDCTDVSDCWRFVCSFEITP